MIKTIICKDPKELDQLCNDFMIQQRKNLPVRTETIVYNFGNQISVEHKATIFYDHNFKYPDEQEMDDIEIETLTINEEKIGKGAIWKQKDGSLKGKWNDENIDIPEKLTTLILSNPKVETKVKGVNCVIIPNKYKDSPKKPDYVILPKK